VPDSANAMTMVPKSLAFIRCPHLSKFTGQGDWILHGDVVLADSGLPVGIDVLSVRSGKTFL
jgi:hypothetical protein